MGNLAFDDAGALRLVRSVARAAETAPAFEATRAPAPAEVLARTVQDEVIPRLLLARVAALPHPALPAPADRPHAAPQATPQAGHVAELVRIALDSPQPEVTAYVEDLRSAGMPIERLMLGLLAPAARRMGVMWEEDVCSFSDVTLGTLRLANVLRLLGCAFTEGVQACTAGPRALLVQAPGEQHGLGLSMVQHFFRRAGWTVQAAPAATAADLARLVRQTSFALLGISVGCDDRMERLAADITTLRAASANPELVVMVGGAPFLAHPQLAGMVGADATASDGNAAVRTASLLVSQAAARRAAE